MAGSQAIHQIEYRWQQARDMSAVASSMSPESYRSWIQRIGPWVRHPGVETPTGSVRYERYGDKAAALAWRQRDRQAVGSGDGRPLVSRVLIGPADLLGPDVAMAVCYAGLPPELIGPPPCLHLSRSQARAGWAAISRPSAERAIATIWRALSPA